MRSLATIGGAALVAAAACGRSSAPVTVGGPAREAAAYRVAAEPGPIRYEAAGSVRPLHRAELATRLTGTVRAVRVRAGDRVGAGQVLVTLDSGSPEAGLEEARAGLELANRTLHRMERLFADSAVPAAQLDAARAAAAQAESRARSAQSDLGYAVLRAPFAGIVTERLADPGDLAVPGRPLLVIEDTGAREIVVGVPDDLLEGIKVGSLVPVRIGAGDRRMEGRVIAIVPVSDAGTRTAEVRISAPAGLPSGASAIAEFPAGSSSELRVPARALIRRGQLVGVLLFAPDTTVRLRWIRIGRIAAGRAEVLAGIADGDLIAVNPDSLADGARVRPRVEAPAR